MTGILSDRDIVRELSYAHGLKIEGLAYKDIGPASVDVYLGNTFVRCTESNYPYTIEDPEHYMPIEPGEFMLATTREYIEIPDNIACQVHGCSSIGRSGLFVQNAGWVDPGFRGELTLELFNASCERIELCPGQRIAQLTFQYLHTPCAVPYQGRYVGQRGATAARPPKETA